MIDDLKQFLGNKVLIQKLNDYCISNYPFKVLLFGSSGSGKSTLCRLLIEQKLSEKYNVLSIATDQYDDLKVFKQTINNFVYNTSIQTYFDSRQKVIFIDDIDIFFCIERTASSFMLSILDEIIESSNKGKGISPKVSFILTCTNTEEKRMTEFKKKMQVFRLQNPSSQDLFIHFSNTLDDQKKEYDATKLLRLIDTYQNNYRNIANNLFKVNDKKESLESEKEQRLLIDKMAFDMMSILFDKKINHSQVQQVTENSLVPMLMYENYIVELFKHRESNKQYDKKSVLRVITEVSDYFCDGEIIESYGYQNQDWTMYDLVTILKCMPINSCISQLPIKKNVKRYDYVFTQLLTKSALRCNFGKRLGDLTDCGISDVRTLLFLMDCVHQDILTTKNAHKYIGRYGINPEQWTTFCSYYSQFLDMEKSKLSKLKK